MQIVCCFVCSLARESKRQIPRIADTLGLFYRPYACRKGGSGVMRGGEGGLGLGLGGRSCSLRTKEKTVVITVCVYSDLDITLT